VAKATRAAAARIMRIASNSLVIRRQSFADGGSRGCPAASP
jgi:hypothetical protein